MNAINRMSGIAVRTLHWLSTAFLFLIMVTVFLQVVFRYVLGLSVPWTEEAARYLNVWMVFLGCSVAVAREGHIRVSYFIDQLRGPVKAALMLLITLATIAFEVIVFLGAIRLTQLNWNQEATTMPITVSTLYIALIVSALFAVIFLVLQLRNIVAPAGGRK